jgi:SNF2 family DNA or RNA helicase
MGDVIVQKARQRRRFKFVLKKKIFLPQHYGRGSDPFFERLIYLQAEDETIIQGNIDIEDVERVVALASISIAVAIGEEMGGGTMDREAIKTRLQKRLQESEKNQQRIATAIEKQTDPRAAPALARLLNPFLLRRTKADVETSLPSRTEVRVPVLLSAEEWQLYEDARLAALSDLETRKSVMKEQQRRVQVLASLTRLRLLASNPRLFDAHTTVASSKLARLMELVDELVASRQRALVFSQFTSHLALVKEQLDARGLKYVLLDGSTPARQRRARVTAFQDGEVPLFLISLKAGGTGLNLTAATNVIHLDPWWNPAVEDQASDRAHRLGQRKPVTIFRLVAMGTIEEQLLVMHRQKRALVERVLEGKTGAAKVTTDELVALLRGARRQSP